MELKILFHLAIGIYKYIKNNFKQVEKLPIKMHYADDDFFVKKVDRGE